jgi:hypothetical protein
MAGQGFSHAEPPAGGNDDMRRWVKVIEAANKLGVSVSTVRRFVKSGKLEGRTVSHGQRTVFWVHLPSGFRPPQRRHAPGSGIVASSASIDPSVVAVPGASLQQALSVLDSIPFTKLSSENLLRLETKLDHYHRAVQFLLEANRLMSESDVIEKP